MRAVRTCSSVIGIPAHLDDSSYFKCLPRLKTPRFGSRKQKCPRGRLTRGASRLPLFSAFSLVGCAGKQDVLLSREGSIGRWQTAANTGKGLLAVGKLLSHVSLKCLGWIAASFSQR